LKGCETFDLTRLRYGKVIIVTEPTSEGSHVRTQVATFLHRLTYPLLAKGIVWLAPPGPFSAMTEDEFEVRVMTPETRSLVRLRAGKSISETLSFVDDICLSS
jgi:DNA gyrase/topoisomerase IV subunit B